MAFFGIRIPKDIIQGIPLEDLRSRYPDVLWEYPADLHLTLRFFPDGRQEIMQKLKANAESFGAFPDFTLRLGPASVFDRGSRGGVLWLGLIDLPEPLRDLQLRLESSARDLGFPPETRAFTPHITLARYTGRESGEIKVILEELSAYSSEPFSVHSFHLMKRTPGLTNAVYGDLLSVFGQEKAPLLG